MTASKFLFALGFAAAAVPSAAAVTVIGNSSARLCFEASESRVPTGAGIENCDRALTSENLSRYDMVATLVNRGILKLRKRDLDSAIADFDSAIKLDPRQAEAYLNKGLAILRMPDGADRAVPLFDTALARKTRKPALAYYARGVAHELGGRTRQAYFDYRQASLLAPDWSDPREQLSRFSVRN